MKVLFKKSYKLYFFIFFFSILLYLFSYMYGPERSDPLNRYAYILLFLSFILLFIRDLVNRNKLKIDPLFALLLVTFNVLLMIMSLLREDLIHALVFPVSQLMVLFVIYSLFNILQKNNLDINYTISVTFIVFGTVSFIFAIIAYAQGGLSLGPLSIYNPDEIRLTGWFGSPNYTSSVFGISLISILYLKTRIKNKHLVLNILLVLMVVGLLLTGSKGAWLAMLIALLFYYILRFNLQILKFKNIAYGGLVVTFLLLLAIYGLKILGFEEEQILFEIARIDSLEGQLDPNNPGGRGRVFYWTTAIDTFRNSDVHIMLFGQGTGGLTNVFGRSAHSGFLTTLINRGGILLGILLLILFYFYKVALQNRYLRYYSIYPITMMTYLVFKNITNNDFPSNGFTGLVFITVLLLVFFKRR